MTWSQAMVPKDDCIYCMCVCERERAREGGAHLQQQCYLRWSWSIRLSLPKSAGISRCQILDLGAHGHFMQSCALYNIQILTSFFFFYFCHFNLSESRLISFYKMSGFSYFFWASILKVGMCKFQLKAAFRCFKPHNDAAFRLFWNRSYGSCSSNDFSYEFVCLCWLLAKIYNIWQVCSFVGLLLAKIYNFWQVCSFVGLSVCLSVC